MIAQLKCINSKTFILFIKFYHRKRGKDCSFRAVPVCRQKGFYLNETDWDSCRKSVSKGDPAGIKNAEGGLLAESAVRF